MSSTPLGVGHHLISVKLDIKGIRPEPSVISTRRLTRRTELDVQNNFNAVDWTSLISAVISGDTAPDDLYTKFSRMLDTLAPKTS